DLLDRGGRRRLLRCLARGLHLVVFLDLLLRLLRRLRFGVHDGILKALVREIAELIEHVLRVTPKGLKEARQLFAAVIGDVDVVLELSKDLLRLLGNRVDLVGGEVHLPRAQEIGNEKDHSKDQDQDPEQDEVTYEELLPVLAAIRHGLLLLVLSPLDREVVQDQEEGRHAQGVNQVHQLQEPLGEVLKVIERPKPLDLRAKAVDHVVDDLGDRRDADPPQDEQEDHRYQEG